MKITSSWKFSSNANRWTKLAFIILHAPLALICMICSRILSVIVGILNLDYFIYSENHTQAGTPAPGTEQGTTIITEFHDPTIARL